MHIEEKTGFKLIFLSPIECFTYFKVSNKIHGFHFCINTELSTEYHLSFVTMDLKVSYFDKCTVHFWSRGEKDIFNDGLKSFHRNVKVFSFQKVKLLYLDVLSTILHVCMSSCWTENVRSVD